MSNSTTAGTFSPRTLRAWRHTAYEAAGCTAFVDRRSSAIDAVLRQHHQRIAGFVTAWNPMGQRLPPGVNTRRMRALRQAARRLIYLTGQGTGQTTRGFTDSHWAEDHLLILAPPGRLVSLARRFRQRGIVIVRRGQAARILILR